MRIIRVSSCAGCDPYGKGTYCRHPKFVGIGMVIDVHVNTKTLPENCPLEEVQYVIPEIPGDNGIRNRQMG